MPHLGRAAFSSASRGIRGIGVITVCTGMSFREGPSGALKRPLENLEEISATLKTFRGRGAHYSPVFEVVLERQVPATTTVSITSRTMV